MGGGGGGYERPPGDSGSDGEDDEREPGVVPEPDPDEGTTEETEDSDDDSGDSPDGPPVGGVVGGGGAPAGVPAGGSAGNGGESGTEEETEPSQEGDHQEEEDGEESQEGPEDHTDGDQTDSDEGDDSEDEPNDDEDEQQEEEDHDEDDEEEDECLISESALLHSPNPDPLNDAAEGDICTVQRRDQAVCVVDSVERVIGSIAEPWVDTLKECIKEGRRYRAHILEIDGGSCEVYVTNKCLLDQDIVLTNSTSTEENQIHPGTYLAIEKTSGEVLAVTPDESDVGEVPPPWAELLSDCIDQGREYRAQVIDIGSDQCRVNIQNSPVEE